MYRLSSDHRYMTTPLTSRAWMPRPVFCVSGLPAVGIGRRREKEVADAVDGAEVGDPLAVGRELRRVVARAREEGRERDQRIGLGGAVAAGAARSSRRRRARAVQSTSQEAPNEIRSRFDLLPSRHPRLLLLQTPPHDALRALVERELPHRGHRQELDQVGQEHEREQHAERARWRRGSPLWDRTRTSRASGTRQPPEMATASLHHHQMKREVVAGAVLAGLQAVVLDDVGEHRRRRHRAAATQASPSGTR